jgi:hypothetical protein
MHHLLRFAMSVMDTAPYESFAKGLILWKDWKEQKLLVRQVHNGRIGISTTVNKGLVKIILVVGNVRNKVSEIFHCDVRVDIDLANLRVPVILIERLMVVANVECSESFLPIYARDLNRRDRISFGLLQ